MGWTVNDMPSLAGKLAIVTGSNSGLGYQTALVLAGAGAETIVAARSRDKGEAAVARIRATHPEAKVRFEPLDLGSLASVAAFAERIAAAHDRLNILVNNAGVMALPQRETTEDGSSADWRQLPGPFRADRPVDAAAAQDRRCARSFSSAASRTNGARRAGLRQSAGRGRYNAGGHTPSRSSPCCVRAGAGPAVGAGDWGVASMAPAHPAGRRAD